MKTLAILTVGIIALMCASCTNMPAGMMQPGCAGYVTQLGGKLELTMPNGATAKIDNQKSFEKAAGTIGTSINLITIAKALDRMFDSTDTTTAADAATAQNASNNSAATAQNASNNATQVELAGMEEAAATVPVTP